MFGLPGARECTLTQEQKANLFQKVIRTDLRTAELMDASRKGNKLMAQGGQREEMGDFTKARQLYEKSIEQDKHPLAICNLALWYLQGRPGMPKDPPKAVEMFRRAADLGVGMALANLADFYLHGKHGVDKDVGKAYELARAAIADDLNTSDSLAVAFFVLYQIHREDSRPGKAKNPRAALRCLEYLALVDDPTNTRLRATDHLLAMARFEVLHGAEAQQSEADRRYDRMSHALEQLPADQKPSTYGEFMTALRRYGFESDSERGLPRDRNKKCNWGQFVQAAGSWRLIKGFTFPDEAAAEGDGGHDDGDIDEVTGRRATPAASGGSGRAASSSASSAAAASGSRDDAAAAGAGSSSRSIGRGGGSTSAGGTAATLGATVGTGSAGTTSIGAGTSSGDGSGDGGVKGGGVGFRCGQCNKMGATKKCSRCGQHYCSAECQRQDWRRGHKAICDMVAAQRE